MLCAFFISISECATESFRLVESVLALVRYPRLGGVDRRPIRNRGLALVLRGLREARVLLWK